MAYQPKSYRKFVATAATATLVATAFAPFASAHSFKDVETKYNEAVDYLVSKGVTGYTDGTFKTQKTITRLEAAEMLGKALGLTEVKDAPASGFTDVPARVATLINAFKAKGITAGKTATTFGANDNITRGELAIWIQKAYDLKAKEGSSNKFGDVADRYKTAVQALVDNEITQGTTETTFGTTANAKRGDYALFIKRAVDASTTDVASVKAINATTVEVTYKEAVTDISAAKYTIDGLTVSNAAIKQTDAKTVVLTTSAQEGGKTYTVKNNGTSVGTFKGVSAVIPTGIKVVEQSIQGVLGQEVTVKAQVTVKEGDSKAGVPVTFNVTSSNAALNAPQVVEATTNEEGVATYTYTRYATTNDTVVAYATGDRTKFSNGTVYWAPAQQLTIKDVTGVNKLANNDSKVYEINSANNANKYLFVTFKENLGVTADKVIRTVAAKGSSTYLLDSNNTITGTLSDHPYEITTGSKAVIAVKLDANGKANLVLAGTNATVTPVVYEGVAVDGTDAGTIAGDQLSEFTNASYNATALQASAPALTFEAKHSLGLTIEAQGVANAATYKNANETGGRDYTVTYVDKDGKPAKAGSPVQIAIPVQTASDNVFLIDADGNKVTGSRVGEYRVFNETVKGTEGKVTFTVGSGEITQYVEPIAFIDNGTGIGSKTGLDATDLQAKGAATHFTNAVTYSTSLTLVDSAGKEIKSVYANGVEKAYFQYETVDQNGKPRAYRLANGTTAPTTVTYTVHAGTSPLTVVNYTGQISAGGTNTYNVVIPADKFSGALEVTSTAASTATVSATATVAGLVLGTTNTVSATFTNTSTANVSGTVTAVNKNTSVVTIGNVPYSLTGATYLNLGTVVPTLQAFYDHLAVGKEVSVTKDADGKLVFNVLPSTAGLTDPAAIVAAVNNAVTKTDVENALRNVAEFNKLTAAEKAALVTSIHTYVTSTPATYANYSELFAEITAVTVINLSTTASSQTYKAAVADTQASQSKVVGTANTTLEIATNTNKPTNYNGYTIKLDTTTEYTTTTATLDATNKIVTVKLANTLVDGASSISATLSDVKTAIEGIAGLNLKVSATDLNVKAKAENLTFTTGVNFTQGTDLIAGTAGELTLTFSEKVNAKAGDIVSIDVIKAGGTVATVNGTVKADVTNAAEVVVQFASNPGIVVSTDKLKAVKGISTVDYKTIAVGSEVTIVATL